MHDHQNNGSNSIVQQLVSWTAAHREELEAAGIYLEEYFPESGSGFEWKAGIGLIMGEITVGFTVWEQTTFHADLTVVGGTGDALQIEYLTPSSPADIEPVLDAVVARLAQGDYLKV
jgi:hypothetical protein